MADWWAAANLDTPEVEAYRPYLRERVLDAGCGAGRLLVPWRREGIDIDGCDASADMVARCREAAPGATLWVSRLHELDPPRKYGTILCCGDAVDEDDRCVHITIRAQSGDRVEEHKLTMRQWYRDELLPLLERSGFPRVDVLPEVVENIAVYVASRDGDLQSLPRRG